MLHMHSTCSRYLLAAAKMDRGAACASRSIASDPRCEGWTAWARISEGTQRRAARLWSLWHSCLMRAGAVHAGGLDYLTLPTVHSYIHLLPHATAPAAARAGSPQARLHLARASRPRRSNVNTLCRMSTSWRQQDGEGVVFRDPSSRYPQRRDILQVPPALATRRAACYCHVKLGSASCAWRSRSDQVTAHPSRRAKGPRRPDAHVSQTHTGTPLRCAAGGKEEILHLTVMHRWALEQPHPRPRLR
ncbi:hypothetical protein EJ07DRAFT_153326 [Lizonia empirigonia]|nr:hypothetical protein EJ07DRAFT_153326 [Lizonia empirigonia]